jgi:hypothetical protein
VLVVAWLSYFRWGGVLVVARVSGAGGEELVEGVEFVDAPFVGGVGLELAS